MKLLFVTNNTLTIDGTMAVVKVETDGSMLYVTLSKIPRATVNVGMFRVSCMYNGEERDLSSKDLAGKTAVFPYSDDVKEVTVIGDDIYYNNEPENAIDFCWKGGIADADPKVNVDFRGLRYNQSYKFTFDYEKNDGYKIYLINMYANTRRDSDGRWFRLTLVNGKRDGAQLSGNVTSIFVGRSQVEFILYFACYKSDSDGIYDYVGLYEYVSPIYKISELGTPYAPYNVDCEALYNGNAVSWECVSDNEFPNVSFELQRAVGREEFETIYAGYEKNYTDTALTASHGTEYRVRTVSGENYSPWVYKTEENPDTAIVSNLYLGIGGNAVRAAGVYVGVGGVPVLTHGQVTVG